MKDLLAFGLGIGTRDRQNSQFLEVYFPHLSLSRETAITDIARAAARVLGYVEGNRSIAVTNQQLEQILNEAPQADLEGLRKLNSGKTANGRQQLVAVFLSTDTAPASIEEIYLKLSLLSNRMAKPHELNLEGIFKLLPNVAWTSAGAMLPDEVPQRVLEARVNGAHFEVFSVDKFPKMINYAIPDGVRVADGARVRLGAHLGSGTTVMHEGFVNFNAGTAGPNMVEGRISAGVFIGAGSDLGGGSSTMGTLSGGGKTVITLGEKCLIGANAGTGIPLGDNCTIESGLYITAGTKVQLLDERSTLVREVRARDLAGKSGLVFRRNSISGAVEALPQKQAVELNADLHANQSRSSAVAP